MAEHSLAKTDPGTLDHLSLTRVSQLLPRTSLQRIFLPVEQEPDWLAVFL